MGGNEKDGVTRRFLEERWGKGYLMLEVRNGLMVGVEKSLVMREVGITERS